MTLIVGVAKALRILIVAMTAAICFISHIAVTTARAEKIPTVIEVHLRDRLLTLKAANAPLAEVLIEIGKCAGFKTVLKGDLRSPVNISATDIPLTDGIRRLVGNCSVAFVHNAVDDSDVQAAEPVLSAIWVFETEGSNLSTTHKNNDMKVSENDMHASIAAVQMQTESHERSQTFRTDGVDIPLEIDNNSDIEYLSHLLVKQKDPYAREQAIAGLARIGSDLAVAAMATALGDTDKAVRRQVVEGLGQVGSELATQILGQALLGDPNPEIRLEAVRALAKLGGEISQAFVTAAANDSDKRVKRSARQTLQKW